MINKKTVFIPLAIVVLLTALAVAQIPSLKFDYHFESFFPADDPELTFFNDFKEKFGNDNDYILIGIGEEDGIFNEPFLKEVTRLSDSLGGIRGIEQVLGPSGISFFVSGPFGPVQVPFLHPDDPKKYPSDSARIYSQREITGSFFSDSANAVNIVLQTVPEPSKAVSDSIVEQLNSILSQFHFDELHVAGKVPAQFNYIRRMQMELVIFISLAVILLIVTLTLMFRSFWAVLIPLITVFLSIAWLLGIMAATGKDIDLIMTLMPTMLFVVAMSDSIHFLSRYTELLREGFSKSIALRNTIREIGLATFLTSLTTAVGFFTLITASIRPLQEFGIYIAIGVGCAFVLTFLIFPPVLFLVPPPATTKMNRKYSEKWSKLLRSMLRLAFSHKKTVLWITGGVVLLSLAGISQMKMNSFLLEDLSKNDPLKLDFLYLEENFGGVRPNEVAVTVKDSGHIWDYENILTMEAVSVFIRKYYNTGPQTSVVSFVKLLNQAVHGGNSDYYRVPVNHEEYVPVKRLLLSMRKHPLVSSFLTSDGKSASISSRMGDAGSRLVGLKDEQFYRKVTGIADPMKLEFHLTGTARLIDKNISYLSANMIQGLLFAFLLIAVISGMMFRSARMVLFALVPNIIPLLMIGGIMGFMGIGLKVSTSIIFTIAFGIAVDDTIHFLTRLRMERGAGKKVSWSIRRSMNITGRAIILTSIVLIAGFITLIFSEFEGTWLVGFLISLTLLFAILCDLLLLPVLLLALRDKKGRETRVKG